MGMDDNAGLYAQKLCYNKTLGPYQCLSLPWWVRTSSHGTYPPRHGCSLEPLICGEEVFGSIHNDLLKAHRSVDIITWGFDPGMVLVRNGGAEDGMRYGELLKQIATRKDQPVNVRLLLWHDDAASYALQKNNPGLYGNRIPTIGAYAGFFGETHDQYNRDWFDEVIAGRVPNIALQTREVALALRGPALEGEHYKLSTVSGTLGSIYPTHHQKMILIDYDTPARAVGYVMGHNSTTDFWDTAAHGYRDHRRETLYKKNPADAAGDQFTAAIDEAWDMYNRQIRQGMPGEAPKRRTERLAEFSRKYAFTAKPYQDVSLRVRGPILYDMNHNFCHGWAESERATSTLSNALWMTPVAAIKAAIVVADALNKTPAPVPQVVQSRQHIKPADFVLRGCQHSAQLMRTYPANKEKTIKECYANLTRLTQHYIFIQNQYIQYVDWATHLTGCVEKLRSAGYTKPIYVFIVTSTPESDGMDLATYDIAKQLGRSDTMAVEHAEQLALARRGKTTMPITAAELEKHGVRALMASMWSGAPQPRSVDDYEEIYIHAKVAIVDDAAFTVGSANLNVRSMALDSELNLLSQAMDVALDLRRKLFKQCTDEEGPAQFGDMERTFSNWLNLMKANSDAMAKRMPLSGQIATFHVDRQPGAPVI